MSELKNEFSWSFSRHQTLKACARRYYFRHYKHWGGWADDAPPEVREIYRLTKLDSRFPWQGSVIHRAVARSLIAARRGQPLRDPESAVQEAIGWMRQDWRDSKDDLARRTGNYKLHVRFVEHETGADDGSPQWRARWKESAGTVETALRGFFASPLYARLAALPEADWIEIDDPSGRTPPSFEYQGVKVHAKVDCAWREDGRAVVVDWKTGRRDLPPLPTQLAAYALYMQHRHGIPPGDVVAREINLVTGKVQEHDVGREALEVFREVFEESVQLMRSHLSDAAGNVPRAEGEFAFTEDERECRFCTFRTVCPRITPAF
jgi:hypothetical protein